MTSTEETTIAVEPTRSTAIKSNFASFPKSYVARVASFRNLRNANIERHCIYFFVFALFPICHLLRDFDWARLLSIAFNLFLRLIAILNRSASLNLQLSTSAFRFVPSPRNHSAPSRFRFILNALNENETLNYCLPSSRFQHPAREINLIEFANGER